MNESIIYQILHKKKITEYLESKNITPVRTGYHGRLYYLCPFPDHNESKPSFVVFTNDEYENFNCFGCSRNYNIIHLVSGLENITYKDAVKQLGIDFDLSLLDHLDTQVKMIDNLFKNKKPYKDQLGVLLSDIAYSCRLYLKSVNYKQEEQSIIDNLFFQIDNCLYHYKFEEIEDIQRNLSKILLARKKKILTSKKINAS